MDATALIEALRNKGENAAQVVGNAARGYFGLDPSQDANTSGHEAYRNLQALSMAPLAGLPAGVVKGGSNVVQMLRKGSTGAKAAKAAEAAIPEVGAALKAAPPEAMGVTKLNSAEANARAAIDELQKYSKYFGLNVPDYPKSMPLPLIMSDMHYYYGMQPEVAALAPEKLARLKELWYRVEDAGNALHRAGADGGLLGKK